MRIELHPEALAELRAASLWYEERQEQLGDEFLDAVSVTLEKIGEAPESYARWTGTERAAVVIREALSSDFLTALASNNVKQASLYRVSLIRRGGHCTG